MFLPTLRVQNLFSNIQRRNQMATILSRSSHLSGRFLRIIAGCFNACHYDKCLELGQTATQTFTNTRLQKKEKKAIIDFVFPSTWSANEKPHVNSGKAQVPIIIAY